MPERNRATETRCDLKQVSLADSQSCQTAFPNEAQPPESQIPLLARSRERMNEHVLLLADATHHNQRQTNDSESHMSSDQPLDLSGKLNETIQHDITNTLPHRNKGTNKPKHTTHSLSTPSTNVCELIRQPTQDAKQIIKIAGKKLRLPHALYKVYVQGKKEPLWLSATMDYTGAQHKKRMQKRANLKRNLG
jgi:hypothetical protein